MSDFDVRTILHKSSRDLCLKAARKAIKSKDVLTQLLALSFSNEGPYSWRSAWTLFYLSELAPEVIEPHLRTIAEKLPEIPNHKQVSSFLRVFREVDFDVDEFGDLLDFCMLLLTKPLPREYLKVIALDIMLKFSKAYPELNEEMIEQVNLASRNFELEYLKRKSKDFIEILQKNAEK